MSRNSEKPVTRDSVGEDPGKTPRGAYRSSWKNAVLNCGFAGAGTFVVLGFVLGWKNWTWIYDLIIGGLAFGIYFLRFLFRTPRQIRIDEKGITVVKRKGERIYLPWGEITEAFLGRAEDIWRLSTPDRTLVFSDDGFSAIQWEALKKGVKGCLKREGIPVQTPKKRKGGMQKIEQPTGKGRAGEGRRDE